MIRTDCHRPSVIDPADYEFVGIEYLKTEEIGELFMLAEDRRRIQEHMDRTGGTYSRHRHGGNCHICGAHAIYTVLFYHRPSNVYIRTGFECADKLDYCDEARFRRVRDAVSAAREAKAGKLKAQGILAEIGLSRAWELYTGDEPDAGIWEYNTLCDIVDKLVRWGSISDKQVEFLRKLVDKLDNFEQREAERAARIEAERAAAEDCPAGRVTVRAEVIKTEVRYTQYGDQLKMLVKSDRGFRLWGSVPGNLQLFDDGDFQRGLQRGDWIEFTATLEQSRDDAKFGFFKRPTKARLLDSATA